LRYRLFLLALFFALMSRVVGAQAPNSHGDFYNYTWFHHATGDGLCTVEGSCGPYDCTIDFPNSPRIRLHFTFSRESVHIFNRNTRVGYRDQGWENHVAERIILNDTGGLTLTTALNMSADELRDADVFFREMSTRVIMCLALNEPEARARARRESI
jgi:hypothetical protein